MRLGSRLEAALDVGDDVRQSIVPTLVLQPCAAAANRSTVTPRRTSARGFATGTESTRG